jgi:hypothetical protein
MKHFLNGVNLGGWLSQYPDYDHTHFCTFITQDDIKQIASWGMDHIRLPVDYPLLESDEAIGTYREDGFQYIDCCLEWCQANDLGMVFDLHRAPGYTFNNTLQAETLHLNNLFTSGIAQQRFIGLWEAILHRYKDVRIPIIFELLNEVVLPNSSPWNVLAQKTVASLRSISPDCKIMIGSNHYNAASDLKYIELFDDPNICYTFHFYEPILFTHQKAPWVQVACEYNQNVEYPGIYTGLAEFLERFPSYNPGLDWQVDRMVDRTLLLEFLHPAFDFTRQTGRDLYCGEFGVIEYVNPISRRNWHADLVTALSQHGIGHAVWTYKQMDFGLVDAHGQVIDPDLLHLLCK